MTRTITALGLALLTACGSRTAFESGAPAAERDASVGTPECPGGCDDGIPCTIDACEAGRCVARPDDAACGPATFCGGPPRCDARLGCTFPRPGCDDGLDCTEDVCDEARRSCEHLPDADYCPLSARCDAALGCVPRALVHDETTLYEVDLPSAALHRLGPVDRVLADVALGADGSLYGVVRNEIFSLDERTGRTAHAMHISGVGTALDFAPDGSLYVGTFEEIARLDLAGRTREPVSRFPPGWHASGDIAFVGARMLVSAARSVGGDHLFEVPLDGREMIDVGPIGVSCVWGLAAHGEALYGFTCEGLVLAIDPRTGAGEVLADVGLRMAGAAAR
ncbi:MAG: hypothetical protein KF729_38680 [Sandaracinaceae bacterium]|nr:hypothetical protein [Sandaracinaceae bacterium]